MLQIKGKLAERVIKFLFMNVSVVQIKVLPHYFTVATSYNLVNKIIVKLAHAEG